MQLKEISKREFEELFKHENFSFLNGCCFDEETVKYYKIIIEIVLTKSNDDVKL